MVSRKLVVMSRAHGSPSRRSRCTPPCISDFWDSTLVRAEVVECDSVVTEHHARERPGACPIDFPVPHHLGQRDPERAPRGLGGDIRALFPPLIGTTLEGVGAEEHLV